MGRIVGGTGGDIKEAIVDGDGQLLVSSLSRVGEEWHSEQKGTAFIIHARCHLAAAASGGLIYIQNDETIKRVHITRIYIDPFTLTTPVIISQIKNPATITGGTDISLSTSVGITQKNFPSGVLFDGTVKQSDGSSDITYTGGQEYHAFMANSLTSTKRNMNGTNILGKNDVLLFGWETEAGGNATNGEIISLSINIYLDEH